MPDSPITNFKDSNDVDLGKKLVTKDYLLEVYGTILENSPASGLIVTPELWGWGHGRYLGIMDISNKSTPVTVFSGGTNWKQVTCGETYSAAIKTDGTLWHWFNDQFSPVIAFGGANNWKSITAGRGHRAAIKTDGSLWLWGTNATYANTGSRLGINDTSTTVRATPVTTFAGGNDWKSVACGYDYTAAIKTDGSLWTWGNNSDGQLGINNTTHKYTPVTTFAGGNTWKSVSVGRGITGAVKTDGSLWACGSTWYGQCGNRAAGIFTSVRTPITTFAGGNTWKQVYCGGYNTAAVKTDGTLWIWGNNFYQQLPINATGQRNTPVTTFAGGTTWKQTTTNMAIKTDGSLWVWGNNASGQLGTNDTTTRSTPVTTFAGGNNWKQVATGDQHNAAIKTDGTLWTWGLNTGQATGGQLGTNDTTQRNTPVTTFAGGNDWKQVSGGNAHTKAIKSIDYI